MNLALFCFFFVAFFLSLFIYLVYILISDFKSFHREIRENTKKTAIMYLLQAHHCVRSMERKIKEGRRQARRQERGEKR